MSITDSTTTIDTAWTENDIPIPAFTAGALSTLSACVDEVGVKLQRGALSATSVPTDANVKTWLMRAKLKLMQVRDFSYARKYAYVSTVVDQYRYILPPDFQGGHVSIRDTTGGYKLRQWPEAWGDKLYPDPTAETSDEPAVFTIKNMELWLYPPSSDERVLQMEYSRSGAETTAGDMSWLPEYERFLCCDFAVAHSFESLHMWAESDRYSARWAEELGISIRADGRRRWKAGQMRCISVFEEYNARNNQQS